MNSTEIRGISALLRLLGRTGNENLVPAVIIGTLAGLLVSIPSLIVASAKGRPKAPYAWTHAVCGAVGGLILAIPAAFITLVYLSFQTKKAE